MKKYIFQEINLVPKKDSKDSFIISYPKENISDWSFSGEFKKISQKEFKELYKKLLPLYANNIQKSGNKTDGGTESQFNANLITAIVKLKGNPVEIKINKTPKDWDGYYLTFIFSTSSVNYHFPNYFDFAFSIEQLSKFIKFT